MASNNLLRLDRLAALAATGLMDSPREQEFDRVTRLICRLMGVDVALISLVDDERQYFKASSGLPEPVASARQTPLTHSFCQYVVRDDAPLIIPDALADDQLKTHPAVRDLGVIAYLGVPIRGPEGQPLGSLCAIQHAPRMWSVDNKDTIEDFARIVEGMIKTRERANDALSLARESDTLAREYNHRAKNTLAVATSLVRLSARDATGVDDLSDKLRERFAALAEAHDALLEAPERIDIAALLERLISPFLHGEAKVRASGPQLLLERSQITPFSLLAHELATNSAKYGAIRLDEPIEIVWKVADGQAQVIWREDLQQEIEDESAHEPGFGQKLFTLVARQLEGTIEHRWAGPVLTVTISFPCEDA